MGGRGAGSSIPTGTPGGGGLGGGKNDPMDAMPGQPKTLAEALGTKGRPMSTDRAVLGANPFYAGGSNREYSENCQRVVIATEARFRGYNVIAQPTYDGDTMPRSGNWKNCFVGAKTENVGRTTARATQKSVESQMSKYGNGSRAVLRVEWSGQGQKHDGHVINVVHRNGKTYYYDGQTGNKYNGATLFNKTRTNRTELVRVDNLQFSDKAKEAVRTNPRRK